MSSLQQPLLLRPRVLHSSYFFFRYVLCAHDLWELQDTTVFIPLRLDWKIAARTLLVKLNC